MELILQNEIEAHAQYFWVIKSKATSYEPVALLRILNISVRSAGQK